jgi:Tol biopolymer transport system component
MVMSVAWSPDGSRLAWTESTGDGHTVTVWAGGPDASDARVVATSSDIGPQNTGGGFSTVTWSPDSAMLAFNLDTNPASERLPSSDVFTVHADGSSLAPVTSYRGHRAAAPAWASRAP